MQDVNPSGGSNPFGFTDVNGTAFFSAFTGAGPELYRSTGIGAQQVSNQFSSGSAPNQLTNVGGTLFFVATGGTTPTGQELWKATIEPTPPPRPALGHAEHAATGQAEVQEKEEAPRGRGQEVQEAQEEEVAKRA